MNSTEFRIPNSNYQADGYFKETNTIYEFHGCYYHGCLKCFDIFGKDKINKINKKNMCELYLNTITKDTFIQSQGFNLVTLWEHEWDEFVKNNKLDNQIDNDSINNINKDNKNDEDDKIIDINTSKASKKKLKKKNINIID